MNQNSNIDIETPAISVLAAASKTPFRTALKVTLGIALGRLLSFTIFVSIVVIAVKILK